MIRKMSEQKREVRQQMRGGQGEVLLNHYWSQGEIKGKCRLCAQLIIPPGAGIGSHEHAGEDEVYIIQQGSALLEEGGKETLLVPGDTVLTGNGASHAIRNAGADNLVITAFIVQY